jgi:predicted O-methyltransferase YrrM
MSPLISIARRCIIAFAMGNKSLIPEAVESYVNDVVTRETPAQRRLRDETARMQQAFLQISAEQAAFLQLAARMVGARRAIEVGTFTGYSALAVAMALPDDGRLVACDINEEWTAIARRHWDAAGVGQKIELRLGPAKATLDALLAAGEAGTYDFAFIDADKLGYDDYYERCLRLLRPGGMIALDNMLWSGKVADVAAVAEDEETAALARLNAKVRDDARVDMALISVGDGLLLARKR